MSINVLNPAASGKFIASNAAYVTISDKGIYNLCDELLSSLKTGKLQVPDPGGGDFEFQKDNLHAVDCIFVTDALNFCFWSNEKQGWAVDGHTGYFALQAAFLRAKKDGKDLASPEYYSKITKEELQHVFRSDTKTEIPLIDQRLNILHEIGDILINNYHGTFEACIRESNYNAEELLKVVVENFPSFRDEAEFNGKMVSFYKRAQVLVSHLAKHFEENRLGIFLRIEKLTMFADYRVPQVLCYFGVLRYNDELMEKLRKNSILPSGSAEEVEIRGCSIHAVELLKKCLTEKLNCEYGKKQEGLCTKFEIDVPNSMLLDYYLWCYRRKYAKKLIKVPFHKTLGIYY